MMDNRFVSVHEIFMMLPFLLVILQQLPFLQSMEKCVWYGQHKTDSGQILNKKYDGPPKPANEPIITLLKKQCPHLVSNSTRTCCDEEQLHELISRSKTIGSILGRCPLCVHNLYAYFCEFTCSPNQSDFMEVLSVENDNLINGIKYSVSKPYLDSVINSCKDVSYSSGGQKGLSFVCGSNECTSELLVEQFSVMSPFKTSIFLDDSNYNQSLQVKNVLKCNETYTFPLANLTIPSCACLDCESSCERNCSLNPYPKYSFDLLGFNGYMIISVLVGVALSAVALTSLVFGYSIDATSGQTQYAYANEQTGFISGQSPEISMGRFVNLLSNSYLVLAKLVCRFPITSILQAIILCTILSSGLPRMETSTDPNVIWSISNSRALANTKHFKSRFKEPFFRTTQIILVPKDNEPWLHFVANDFFGVPFSSAFRREVLEQVFKLEDSIQNLRTPSNVSLDSLCIKPLKPVNNNCTILSVTQYFQRNMDLLNRTIGEPYSAPIADFATHLAYCIESPFATLDAKFGASCLGDFGGPVEPLLILGSNGDPRLSAISNTTALVITIPLRDDDEFKDMAMEWEHEFMRFIESSNQDLPFKVIYSTERSIEDEIKRESWTDVNTLVLSYLLMFVYVVIALTLTTVRRDSRRLGVCEKVKQYLSSLRITVAFVSVAFVILAVTASVGFFAWLRIPTTLLIFEVVPFLILAVGVDNVFIIMQHLYRTRSEENLDEVQSSNRVCETMSQVGPGMALSTVAELSAFVFAAILARQYAIRLFALYALVALAINIYIQSTALLALIMLDHRRVYTNRMDVLCCVHVHPGTIENSEEDETNESTELTEPAQCEKPSYFELYSRVLLLNGAVRRIVTGIFTLFFVISLCSLPSISIGLDPKTSLPRDSYVSEYLRGVEQHLQAGPPYFVVLSSENSLELHNLSRQNALCAAQTCDSDSLMNKFANYANCASNVSYLRTAPSSWIDGYIDWANEPDRCCRKLPLNDSVCPHEQESKCVKCNLNRTSDGRLIGYEFNHYLQHFLSDIPDQDKCTLGGHALFGNSIRFTERGEVNDCNFIGYHAPLKTSRDFIGALKRAWAISDEIENDLKRKYEPDSIRFYVHSVFYVFYEQYLTILRDSVINVVIPLSVVALISIVFTGFHWRASLAFLIAIVMILVEELAMIIWMGVELNAVSLVNLVMSIGIAVEFCAHITMHFVRSSCGPVVEDARHALINVGSSVLTGVALTKVTGIAILAFAKSELFSLYFFKMYASLIVASTLNALVMLPCMLASFGKEEKREGQEAELYVDSPDTSIEQQA